MTKYMITSFTNGGGGAFGITGKLLFDGNTEQFSVNVMIDDMNSPVRPQLESQVLAALNEQLSNSGIDLVLTENEIEFIT